MTKRAEILSNEDYQKLLKNIDNPKHRLFLQIARYTGERWGIIRLLKVSDVYTVSRVPSTHISFCSRKTSPGSNKKTRQVPVCDRLQEELQAYNLPINSGWLFFNRLNPSEPMSSKNADRFFHLALDRAGLGGKGYSTQSTRRTLVERLVYSGVGLGVIQQIIGIHDLGSFQFYLDIDDKQLLDALSLI
ncbi:MAG: tyrosine-type recombinase/integrase [Microcoleus vaginatus WJT46-NPBG5]|jgi:integrase/recombinase XerD|nr:tyrosine-type recombinase/integrase [Microcoleus vaginatus WJT46-NPBG5]MBW4680229.1 tyrosine-type recombinase/integrase [Microcoleus vaginatus WJT46-NPBG5]